MQASVDKSKALPGEAEWQEAYAILEVWLTLEINSKIRDFYNRWGKESGNNLIENAAKIIVSRKMEQKKKPF